MISGSTPRAQSYAAAIPLLAFFTIVAVWGIYAMDRHLTGYGVDMAAQARSTVPVFVLAVLFVVLLTVVVRRA